MYKLIVFILCSILVGQNADGDFSLGEISFVIKDFHLGGTMEDRSSRSEINNGIGSLDIGLLKYGFSDIDVSGEFNDYNERAKLKYKFSGPEFEMSNFKMDISFDAPNVWLVIKEELANEYADGAENYFDDIKEAISSYYSIYNELPNSINQLQTMNLLSPPASYSRSRQWDFIYNPPGKIVAESNKEMPGGSGKKIIHEFTGSDIEDYFSSNSYYYYNWETSGYGQYDDWREPGPVKNNVEISVGKVNQYFGSSGTVDINDRNQIAEFQLDKAGFSVSKANATFVVDRTSKSTFSVADFKSIAKNVAFEFDTYNEIPIVEKAGFELSLTNLEINVPKEVQEEEAFKQIADYLNINSGKFRIRDINLTLNFNRSKDLQLKAILDTQFGKAVLNGSFSIRQPIKYDSDLTLDSFTIEVSNLTRPINDFISFWEEETGNTLPRKGKSIYLEIYGDIDNPKIRGLEDLNF